MTIEINTLSKLANKVFKDRPRRLTHDLVYLISMAGSAYAYQDVKTDGQLWEKMERYLKKGADPGQPGDYGEYALEKLCDDSHYGAALRLLAEYPALDADATHGPIRITPLMYALKDTHVPLVRALCEHGADVNADTGSSFNSSRATVFDFLAGKAAGTAADALECMKLLMQHGLIITPEIKKRIYTGATALAPLVPEVQEALDFKKAVETSDTAALQSLLAKGVSPDSGTEYGANHAIIAASAKGDVQAIGLLLKYGADVNTKLPDTGATPLLEAALGGQRDAFIALLKAGADRHATWTDSHKTVRDVKDMAGLCKTDPGMAAFVQTVLDARETPDTPDVSVNHEIKTHKRIQLKHRTP